MGIDPNRMTKNGMTMRKQCKKVLASDYVTSIAKPEKGA